MDQLTQWHIRMEEKVEKILVQTTKTNGRVDNHDKIIDDHDRTLNNLLSDNNQSKGEDKVIWICLTAAGAIALILIGKYLNSF